MSDTTRRGFLQMAVAIPVGSTIKAAHDPNIVTEPGLHRPGDIIIFDSVRAVALHTRNVMIALTEKEATIDTKNYKKLGVLGEPKPIRLRVEAVDSPSCYNLVPVIDHVCFFANELEKVPRGHFIPNAVIFEIGEKRPIIKIVTNIHYKKDDITIEWSGPGLLTVCA